MDSRLLLILIPALPLTGAIVTGLLGARVLKQWSHLPVVATLVAACVCSLMLARQVHERAVAPPGSELIETPDVAGGPVGESTTVGYEEIHVLWTWADIQDAWQSSQPADAAVAAAQSDAGRDFRIDIALRADPLTCIMLVMVTFISSLVAIYASGYMRGDPGYWRFFAYVAIFVFSMTMLVSVSNFLLLFVFWEAVGACSYLLIGFWFEKPSAAAAGKKAFLVNRVGDFGFALALFLIWATYGTWNFHDTPEIHGVLGQARLMDGAFVGGGLGMAICLLLMLGACGKSAQFPLHVWLPDAMEGPTPVSALIHAATMVTAGVYMVTRCTPLFLVSPTAQVTVATIGGFTALLAGLIAITQFDLKRVLAYSTVSQLGYMFLGLGTGTLAGITAGMFHLFTHAFFKALLFLGSGSVMHAMGGIIDMRRFSGLKTKMPITHLTFAIGCLALAGVFPLSGFWSKDAVVASIRDQGLAMQSALHSGSLSEAHLEMHSQANSDPSRSPEARIAGEPLVPSSYVGQPSTASGHPTQEGDHPIGEAVSDAHGDATHEEGHAVTTEHLAHFSHGELACGAAVYPWLYRIALFTALLTAIYTFRAFFMTFYGEEVIPGGGRGPRARVAAVDVVAVGDFGRVRRGGGLRIGVHPSVCRLAGGHTFARLRRRASDSPPRVPPRRSHDQFGVGGGWHRAGGLPLFGEPSRSRSDRELARPAVVATPLSLVAREILHR